MELNFFLLHSCFSDAPRKSDSLEMPNDSNLAHSSSYPLSSEGSTLETSSETSKRDRSSSRRLENSNNSSNYKNNAKKRKKKTDDNVETGSSNNNNGIHPEKLS